MHRVTLSSEGIKFALERQDADTDEMELYPDKLYGPGDAEHWTVADDIMCWLVTSHIRPVAVTESYSDQQKAIVKAASPPHPRGHVAIAFKEMCQAELVDCEYTFETASTDFVRTFAALGSPLRWAILALAWPEPVSMSALCGHTGRDPGGLYHHLGKLEEAGLLFSLGRGQGYLSDNEFLINVLETVLELLHERNTH